MPAALAIDDVLPGPAPAGALARLVGIGKTYGSGENAVAALSDASLEVHPGQLTIIEGPSGSGDPGSIGRGRRLSA